jgi:hypothetical protein
MSKDMRKNNSSITRPSTIQGEILNMANAIVGVKVGERLPLKAILYPTWTVSTEDGKSPLVPFPRQAQKAIVAEYSAQDRSLEALTRVTILHFLSGDRSEVIAAGEPEEYENEFYMDVLRNLTSTWFWSRDTHHSDALAVQAYFDTSQTSVDRVEQPDKANEDIKVTYRTPRLAEKYGPQQVA